MKKTFVKIILFICITVAMFALLGKVLTPKWVSPNTYSAAECLYAEPDNTLEVLILGGSVSAYGISPMELYEQYGICAYNFGSPRQPMLVSYAWLQETYKYHPESLKVLVLEPALLCNTENVTESHYIKGLTYLKMSQIKLKAYIDHYGTFKNALEALSTMFNYHTRWTKLSKNDFTDSAAPLLPYLRGWSDYYTRYIDKTDYNKLGIITGEYREGQESYVLDVESYYYYQKILAFCNSHNIKLLLAKMPNNVSESIWSTAKHNAVASLAEESGVNYIDYNFSPLLDEIGFNSVLDGRDSTHLNVWGTSKVTAHLGKYLTENYDLTDVRNDSGYAFLEDQLQDYRTNVDAIKDLYKITDPAKYLAKAVSENAYTTLIVAKGDAASGLTDEQRSAFNAMGLTELASLPADSPYLAVIENGKITERSAEDYDSEGLTFSGVGADNKEFTLLSSDDSAAITVYSGSYSASENGLFIVLYSPKYKVMLSSVTFPTGSAPERARVDYDEELKEAEAKGLPFDEYSEGLKNYARYVRRKETSQTLKSLNDDLSMTGLLKTFLPQSHTQLFLIDCDGGFKWLTEDVRKTLADMGLTNLAACENGDAYIGIIDKGSVTADLRDSSGEVITLERMNYRLTSGPLTSEEGLLQNISGYEYATTRKGLYVLVYDELLEKIIYKYRFHA